MAFMVSSCRDWLSPVGTSSRSSALLPESIFRRDDSPDERELGPTSDASGHWLAIEPTADVLDRVLIESGVQAARDIADVRGGQYVRQRAKRMVERQRLLVKDIDGSTRDLLGS